MCMIVKIDNLSHDFRGITRIDNKVTFIPDTIPFELVDASPPTAILYSDLTTLSFNALQVSVSTKLNELEIYK